MFEGKQAAADTGIGSSIQTGLCSLSLLLREGKVFLPTLVTAFQCGRGEKHWPEFGVWHSRGSPASTALKGTQVFQCNLVYKSILFLKERTEITGFRICVNSSEPHFASCQKCLLFYPIWQHQANSNCLSMQSWASTTRRWYHQWKRKALRDKTLIATATVRTIHCLLQALIAHIDSEERIQCDRLGWLKSGQFNLFGCRDQGLGLNLFSLPGFKACHSIKCQAVCRHRREIPTLPKATGYGNLEFNLLQAAGHGRHCSGKHQDQRTHCTC